MDEEELEARTQALIKKVFFLEEELGRAIKKQEGHQNWLLSVDNEWREIESRVTILEGDWFRTKERLNRNKNIDEAEQDLLEQHIRTTHNSMNTDEVSRYLQCSKTKATKLMRKLAVRLPDSFELWERIADNQATYGIRFKEKPDGRELWVEK